MAVRGSSRIVSIICQAGMAIGLLLVLAGVLWQSFAKPEHVWTEAKAEEFTAARTELHNLTYDDPQAPSAPESQERAAKREAARRRFDRIRAELDDAAATHRHRGARLMYAGLASVVVFGVGYLASRGD